MNFIRQLGCTRSIRWVLNLENFRENKLVVIILNECLLYGVKFCKFCASTSLLNDLMFQVEVRNWEVTRKEMRGKLMQEEAAIAAQRRIENIESQGINLLSRWFSR